jgi:hypothetical protein
MKWGLDMIYNINETTPVLHGGSVFASLNVNHADEQNCTDINIKQVLPLA